MPTNKPQDYTKTPSSSQSIPLEDLTNSTISTDIEREISQSCLKTKIFRGSGRLKSPMSTQFRYENIDNIYPSSTDVFDSESNCIIKNEKQLKKKEILQNPTSAMKNYPDEPITTGFSGLVVPDKKKSAPLQISILPYDTMGADPTQLDDDQEDDLQSYMSVQQSDIIPLTGECPLQTTGLTEELTTDRQRNNMLRVGHYEARYHGIKESSRHKNSDDGLADTEAGLRSTTVLAPTSYRKSLMPPLSPNASVALSRTGSRIRAISQRVVNISGEAEMIEATAHLEAKREEDKISNNTGTKLGNHYNESDKSLDQKGTTTFKTGSSPKQYLPTAPIEKAMRYFGTTQQAYDDEILSQKPIPNPLKGKTLGIFSPESRIRNMLCTLLVYPLTEPIILILIIIQAIILAVESSQSPQEQPEITTWGSSPTDYALLVIFVIFTFEVAARIIVSGFIFNASEYSRQRANVENKSGVLGALRAIFKPQESPPKKVQNCSLGIQVQSCSLAASQGNFVHTVEQAQRLLLAKRAFLRHSFNRLDFLAVCSYWIAFALYLTGTEERLHLHLFRMLSCLRILRLLALTNGTAIILRSLKKAAPLLVNVSFLIGFFWLIFAIIGVQSFKSSFDRQCVWVDPEDPTNSTGSAFINGDQYCGGYINATTGARQPWVLGPIDNLSPGTKYPKGFLCPRGSLCLQIPPDQLPFSGTVSFDNVFQSLELVFVLMSANTFSDLMYMATNADNFAAVIFFAIAYVVMTLWLLNLLISVITSSFQVIREEGKASAFTSQLKNLQCKVDDLSTQKSSNTLKVWFDKTRWFWILIIAYGISCQTIRSSDMSSFVATFINTSEAVVTLLLLIEIIIRLAMERREFFGGKTNLIDLGLAIITAVMLIPPIRDSGRLYAALSIFQILRIYRIIIAVPITHSLISRVLGDARGIGNLIIFVFLITFLMAIFASELFRGEIEVEGDEAEVNFSTTWNSFIGMFQVLSSEDWTGMLFELTGTSAGRGTGWIPGIFFIGWFILGNFILINMFIAVIQENFDVTEDEKRIHQVKAFLHRTELCSSSSNLSLSSIIRFGRTRHKKDPLDYGPASMEMLLKDTVVKDFLEDEMRMNEKTSSMETQSINSSKDNGVHLNSLWQKLKYRFQNKEVNPFYPSSQLSVFAECSDPRIMAKEAVSATAQRKQAQKEYLVRYPNYNNALYIFKPSNPIRRFCQRIVGPGRGNERIDGVEPSRVLWYTFSAIIYTAIIAMVVIACVTTPLYQKFYFDSLKPNERNWIAWVDMGFTVLFTIEAVIKAIADGLYWTPNAYFRSSWGLIDALVLATLWINIITSLMNDSEVSRAVGAFRALRALRLLNISDSTRDTFHSLFIVGGWKILSAAFVSLSLLLPFAIYGLNLFNGQLLSCNDGDSPNIEALSDCFGEFNSTPFSEEWPILAPRVVGNDFFNFDNFGSSLFILFQIVSQEGWTDVMWACASIAGRGLQPQPLRSQENALFFIVFNLLSNVFILTLFISIFMRNYTEQTGVAFLTAEQRSWLELRKILRNVAPSKRQSIVGANPFKSWCYQRAVQKSGKWYTAVTTLLVFHLFFLLLEYHPQPLWWEEIRNFIFLFFTLFLMAEVGIRIYGLGWSQFSANSWDVYSIVVVTGTLGTAIIILLGIDFPIITQLHKYLLVMIVLLLIPRNDELDQLFKTAAASGANIGNLLALWLVLFLVFAIAMTQTLGLTRFGDNEDNNQNFRTVPKALALLFRMSSGEAWNDIMEDYASIEPPLCVSDPNFLNSDCGSSKWARVLFISWNILSMYIFTSMFVSLIYESFSYVYQNSSGLNRVSRDEIRSFKQAWSIFDTNGTGYIPKEKFPYLLRSLSGVFSMKIYPEQHSVLKILEDVREASYKKNQNATNQIDHFGIDLKELMRRVSIIDPVEIKKSRTQFKLFYEEVMVSADPDRGISFTSVLMILAHYRVIRDNKSLKLEEFLRRRARLQRIEDEVNQRIAVSFFDTMYLSRRFRQYLRDRNSGRMKDIRNYASDGYDYDKENPRITLLRVDSSYLAPQDHANTTSVNESGMDGSTCHRRNISPNSTSGSPVSSPRFRLNRAISSGIELEIGDSLETTDRSRRGSNAGRESVIKAFGHSAWGESIRRSFISRRTN